MVMIGIQTRKSKTNFIILAVMVLTISVPNLFVGAYDATGANISIPSIGVDASIVSIGIRSFPNGEVTWDTTQLTNEIGFLQGTSWFGQGGNIVLGGHSELADRVPTVFYELDRVAIGDEIIVTVDGTEVRYVVTDVFNVNYRDLSILYPSNSERLTLMTCDPESLSGDGYSRRDVVIAERVN